MQKQQSLLYATILLFQSILFIYSQNSKGLVSHYPLQGNLTDITGNYGDLINNGGIQQADDRFDIPTNAYVFTGVPSYQSFYIPVETINGLKDYTISMWFKSNQPDNNQGIFFGMETVHNLVDKIYTEFYVTGIRCASTLNSWSVQDYSFSSRVFSMGSWQHIVFSRDSQNKKFNIYADGALLEQIDNTAVEDDNVVDIQGFSLGMMYTQPGILGEQMKGTVSDLRVYDRAFIESDALLLFQDTSLNCDTSCLSNLALLSSDVVLIDFQLFFNNTGDNEYYHKYEIDFNTFVYDGNKFETKLYLGNNLLEHTVQGNTIQIEYLWNEAELKGCMQYSPIEQQCYFQLQILQAGKIKHKELFTSIVITPDLDDLSVNQSIQVIKEDQAYQKQFDKSIATQLRICEDITCVSYSNPSEVQQNGEVFVELKVIQTGYEVYYPVHDFLYLDGAQIQLVNQAQIDVWNQQGRIIYKFRPTMHSSSIVLAIGVSIQQAIPTRRILSLPSNMDNIGNYIRLKIAQQAVQPPIQPPVQQPQQCFNPKLQPPECACQIGQYKNQVTSQCIKCALKFEKCSSQTQGSCVNKKNRDSQCNCVEGYYFDSRTINCQKNEPQCEQYSEPSESGEQVCQKCRGQNRENAPSCNCKEGYINEGISGDCIQKPQSCKVCANIVAAGPQNGYLLDFYLNGEKIKNLQTSSYDDNSNRGFNLVVLSDSGLRVVETKNFDVVHSQEEAQGMVNYIKSLENNTKVLIGGQQLSDISNINQDLIDALKSLGAPANFEEQLEENYIIVMQGQKGLQQGQAMFEMKEENEADENPISIIANIVETCYQYNGECVQQCPNGTQTNQDKLTCEIKKSKEKPKEGQIKKEQIAIISLVVLLLIIVLIVIQQLCQRGKHKRKENLQEFQQQQSQELSEKQGSITIKQKQMDHSGVSIDLLEQNNNNNNLETNPGQEGATIRNINGISQVSTENEFNSNSNIFMSKRDTQQQLQLNILSNGNSPLKRKRTVSNLNTISRKSSEQQWQQEQQQQQQFQQQEFDSNQFFQQDGISSSIGGSPLKEKKRKQRKRKLKFINQQELNNVIE